MYDYFIFYLINFKNKVILIINDFNKMLCNIYSYEKKTLNVSEITPN